MKRTKLRDRLLPNYSRGEEVFNMTSHIVGGALGVLVLILCICRAVLHRNIWSVVGSAVYGATFIQLYTISSIYHGLRPGTGKKVLQIIDHCTIYIFIAGTYTPIMLSTLRPVYPAWAWSILGGVWGLAALAIVFTAIDLKKYAVFSMICYIGMGWCIILGIKPLIEVLARPGLWLLVAGGITYTIGAVLYGIGSKKRYWHSLFHLFVVAGSVLHALCIFLYVL
ncbi:MAG: hemolysin III family protein [Clostridia bacterium]|nr:hemolysin III family protein [Clostridia bacterium]